MSGAVESQRTALLEALNEYLPTVLPATKLLDQCLISFRETGTIPKESALKTVLALSSLDTRVIKLTEKYCVSLGADGQSIINFVKGDFTSCIIALRDILKPFTEEDIVEGNKEQSTALGKRIVEFRKLPRQLVDKVREAKFENTTKRSPKRGKDNEESSSSRSHDETPPKKTPNKRSYGKKRLSVNVRSLPPANGEDEHDQPIKSPRAAGLRKDGSARPLLTKSQRATEQLTDLVKKSGAKVPTPAGLNSSATTITASETSSSNTTKKPRRVRTVAGDERPQQEDIKREMEKLQTKTASTMKAGDIESEVPKEPKKQEPMRANFSISQFIGMDTDPGKRYGKLNQDAHLYCRTGKYGHVAAVFDGHGVNGEVAANISSDTFREFFTTTDFWSFPVEKRKQMLEQVFVKAHNAIIEKYDALTTIKWEGHKFHLEEIRGLMMYKNKKFGALLQDFGTTAVVAVINTDVNGKVIDIMSANVGDSIAFVGRESTKNPIGVRAMHGLIEMHNGANEAEESRITSVGSRLTDGDYIAPPEASGFGWAQLAVTRSLGHRYFGEYGVIAIPFISTYQINKRDKYLVITSDGVTDVLTSKEILKAVTEFVSTGPAADMQYVATKLVKHSLAMWRKRFGEEGEPADNTTAIVIDLKGFKGVSNMSISKSGKNNNNNINDINNNLVSNDNNNNVSNGVHTVSTTTTTSPEPEKQNDNANNNDNNNNIIYVQPIIQKD